MSNILIGVTGGIAAYKIPYLCRLFVLGGDHVKVIMTENAAKFITPLTFEAITGNRVSIDDFEQLVDPVSIKHIDLAGWADLFVLAPATANTISKIANGVCDNLLTSTVLAYNFRKPFLIAPAMNVNMYKNPIFQRNLEIVKGYGAYIVSPGQGVLACGDEGIGKMAEPEQIYQIAKRSLWTNPPLKGIKVLVTAGPTVEDIDPVRFISNKSSGKMGYAIAEVAFEMGAEVKLISGPTNLTTFVEKRDVYSAEDMFNAVSEEIDRYDILVMAAAVADYRVDQKSDVKIKKDSDSLDLKLIKNRDILKETARFKKDNQIFVGFAAESNELEKNALKKLKEKNLDMIVANDISRKDIGFNANDNEVKIFLKDGSVISYDKMSKKELARHILTLTAHLYGKK
jgi:phosphopantothenoylcysteine decarboxylase/phosphopantothenate--cysteine ligase